MTGPCPWRRAQIKNSHGEITRYGRRCDRERDHDGFHTLPPAAKQSDDGVWYNPETGESVTQHKVSEQAVEDAPHDG